MVTSSEQVAQQTVNSFNQGDFTAIPHAYVIGVDLPKATEYIMTSLRSLPDFQEDFHQLMNAIEHKTELPRKGHTTSLMNLFWFGQALQKNGKGDLFSLSLDYLQEIYKFRTMPHIWEYKPVLLKGMNPRTFSESFTRMIAVTRDVPGSRWQELDYFVEWNAYAGKTRFTKCGLLYSEGAANGYPEG